jgi:hypothetical protein
MRQAVLDLGMEDWIPLPEAVGTPEVRAAIGDEREAWAVLSDVLKALVQERRIVICRGRWDDNDPTDVPGTDVLELLGQERWYAFHPEEQDEERLYFVNVENVHKDV